MFSMLLPVIKLLMRNIYVRTVVHISDELPEVINFNIEIFNALFISYCMQNSPSIGTTLAVVASLTAQLILSLRDVNEAVQRMRRFNIQFPGGTKSNQLTVLELAENMLQKKKLTVKVGVAVTSRNSLPQATKSTKEVIKTDVVKPLGSSLSGVSQYLVGAKIKPAPTEMESMQLKVKDALPISSQSRYIVEVRRLLYLTEFIILINYVGVFIPLIFSIYMVVMYNLPNREYYAQLAYLTDAELCQALQNVMLNCSVKFLALLVLCLVLQCKLKFSAIRQLAFVLDKQWISVQNKTTFRVFYIVQGSLLHQGYDYTFKFSWLRSTTTSANSGNSTGS